MDDEFFNYFASKWSRTYKESLSKYIGLMLDDLNFSSSQGALNAYMLSRLSAPIIYYSNGISSVEAHLGNYIPLETLQLMLEGMLESRADSQFFIEVLDKYIAMKGDLATVSFLHEDMAVIDLFELRINKAIDTEIATRHLRDLYDETLCTGSYNVSYDNYDIM